MNATPKLVDNDDRSAKQLIVQCPKCETKFAIEADGVEELEFPRFHCSRCDNIFGLDESGATSLVTETAPANSTDLAPAAEERVTETDTQVLESSPVVSTAASTKPATFNPFSNPRDILAPQAKGFTLGRAPLEPQLKYTGGQTAGEAAPAVEEHGASRWGGFGLIALPIATLLVLCGVLFILSQSTSGAKAIGSLISTGAPQAAPAELKLGDVSAKPITLDNGELVYVFNMTLSNKSEQSFKEVIVEGLLYDEGGRLIGTERISAASSLTKARIRSLSVEMIRSLQSGKLIRKFELSPGEESDVTFAMVAPAEEVKFFSGRIFSASK